jgi:hypothetical protein
MQPGALLPSISRDAAKVVEYQQCFTFMINFTDQKEKLSLLNDRKFPIRSQHLMCLLQKHASNAFSNPEELLMQIAV